MELVDRACEICGDAESTELLRDGATAYRECVTCHAIYTSPFPAAYTDSVGEAYEAAMPKYAAKIERRFRENQRKLAVLEPYRKTNRMLEIGCNAGATLVAAESLGWRAVGVDISEAPTRYAREERGLDARTGAVETAGLEPDSFDAVYTNAVLEHVEKPRQTLLEARRVLRPGGVFYADTVNWASYTREVLGAHWRYLEPLHHVQLFTPENVRELARRTDFEVLRIWTTGVRLADKKRGEHFRAPAHLRYAKGLFSLASRFTLKGDSIKFLLKKPKHATN